MEPVLCVETAAREGEADAVAPQGSQCLLDLAFCGVSRRYESTSVGLFREIDVYREFCCGGSSVGVCTSTPTEDCGRSANSS